MAGAVDLFLVYSFIKRLATPFKEWKAYELGIIDENGQFLKKRRDLRSREEQQAFGMFDIMIAKLKRLLEKVPGGKTRIASYAAALYLIKEHDEIEKSGELLSEEDLRNKYESYLKMVEHKDIDSLFEAFVDEDAPANNVGGGSIAGTGGAGGEPGLTKKQMDDYKKKGSMPLKRFKDTVK